MGSEYILQILFCEKIPDLLLTREIPKLEKNKQKENRIEKAYKLSLFYSLVY